MLMIVVTSSIHNSLDLVNGNLSLAIIGVQPINLLLNITPDRNQYTYQSLSEQI